MKLLSVHIQYFRQHTTTSLVFRDGTTGIIGANGSGKTTIIEAIAFALFGSRATRGKVEHIRTRNTAKGNKTNVSLMFEHEDQTFRIERSLSTAELYAGGEAKPLVEGTREVTARIEQLLGMTYEEFIATFLTEQKGLEFLSGKKGATERERFIVTMMGYHKLEKMQELLRSDKRDLRNEIKGRESMQVPKESLVEKQKEEERKRAIILEKYDEAGRVLAKAEQKVSVETEALKKQDVLRARVEEMRRALHETEIVCRERKKQLNELAARFSDQGETDPQSLDQLQKQSEELRAKCSVLESSLASKRAEAEQAEQALRDFKTGFDRDLHHATQAVRAADNELKGLRSLSGDGQCPTCNQTLGAAFKEVCQKAEAELVRLFKERDVVAARTAEISGFEQRLDRCREAAEEDRLALKRAQEESARVEARQSEVCAQLSVRERLTSLRSEIEQLKTQQEKAKQEIEKVGYSESAYRAVKGASDAAQRLLEVSRLQRVRLEGELSTQDALIARTTAELERCARQEASLAEMKRTLIGLEESDSALTEFRKYLNDSIRPRLAELASEFLAELSDGRYGAVEIARDFTPTVIDGGESKPVISGGEEDILNLCVRLALSNLLAERSGTAFSLLLLDEVFGSLDEGRRQNVLTLLERLSNRFEQILVITHLDDIKDGVRNLLYVDYDDATGELRVDSHQITWDEALNI